MRFFVALLLAALPLFATAGYERTNWGMPEVEVRALYPGGRSENRFDGHSAYAVPATVAGLPAARVFWFRQARLEKVVIVFMRGDFTKQDWEAQNIRPMSVHDARKTYAHVRAAMVGKYGAPPISDELRSLWRLPNDDVMRLKVMDEPTGATVNLLYGEFKSLMGEVSDGL